MAINVLLRSMNKTNLMQHKLGFKLMSIFRQRVSGMHLSLLQLEGKYTEWPNPEITENHACDRQSGLNDTAPRKHILVAWGKVA